LDPRHCCRQSWSGRGRTTPCIASLGLRASRITAIDTAIVVLLLRHPVSQSLYANGSRRSVCRVVVVDLGPTLDDLVIDSDERPPDDLVRRGPPGFDGEIRQEPLRRVGVIRLGPGDVVVVVQHALRSEVPIVESGQAEPLQDAADSLLLVHADANAELIETLNQFETP